MPMDPANQWQSFQLCVPFWNNVDQRVDYVYVLEDRVLGNNVGDGGISAKVLLYQMLVDMNPIWKNHKTPDQIAWPGMTGEGIIPCANPKSAEIYVTGGAASVDRWWGSAQVGKYGVGCFRSKGSLDIMPLVFFNTQNTKIDLAVDQPSSGFHYILSPGITALIKINLGHEESFSTPRVYYYSTDGEYTWYIGSPVGWPCSPTEET